MGCDSGLVNDTFGSTLPWQGAGVFLTVAWWFTVFTFQKFGIVGGNYFLNIWCVSVGHFYGVPVDDWV